MPDLFWDGVREFLELDVNGALPDGYVANTTMAGGLAGFRHVEHGRAGQPDA
jgi:hypothetical protein